jgi:regulatory protein
MPARPPAPKPSIKAQALRLLARREHSRAELERKLAAKADPGDDGQVAAEIARTLDELATRGLLSDARAAEALLASRAARHGSLRLRQTMLARGLAPELVAASMEQSRHTEYERALALWRRRFGTAAVDAAQRARQMRFLAGRGFEADVIRRVLRAAPEPGKV